MSETLTTRIKKALKEAFPDTYIINVSRDKKDDYIDVIITPPMKLNKVRVGWKPYDENSAKIVKGIYDIANTVVMRFKNEIEYWEEENTPITCWNYYYSIEINDIEE